MRTELLLIAGIFLFFALAEALSDGFLRKPGQRRRDVIVEPISFAVLTGLTQPMVLAGSGLLLSLLLPRAEGALAGLPFLAAFALVLVLDDMVQYWWHRISHSVPWLYALHRPHHDAPYMSVRIVYRNNVFYYLLMPSLWFSGALIYLGLGWVYAVFIILKMTVIISAHSSWRWDAPLYRIGWLSPLMWLVERTISTPATHAAHHGKHQADGVTNYKGNYGNLLFFWDVLFGTAKITRRYPTEFGVENLPETSAAEQLLWPLIRDRQDKGALVPAE